MPSDAAPTPGARSSPDTDATPTRKETSGRPALRTRAGYAWIGLVGAMVIAAVFVVFIVQNLDTAVVSLFTWSFSLPIGIIVLLSAISGALVTALVGGIRILQLRRVAKRG